MNLIHEKYNFSEIDTYFLSLYDDFNRFKDKFIME